MSESRRTNWIVNLSWVSLVFVPAVLLLWATAAPAQDDGAEGEAAEVSAGETSVGLALYADASTRCHGDTGAADTWV